MRDLDQRVAIGKIVECMTRKTNESLDRSDSGIETMQMKER